MDMADDEGEDRGWKVKEDIGRRKGKGRVNVDENVVAVSEERKEEATVSYRFKLLSSHSINKRGIQDRRTRMLKELAARMNRDRMLRYTERELEMQKLLMGKGASKKLKGVEKVEEEDEDESGEERRPKKADEKTWKPRVYKWRVERKR